MRRQFHPILLRHMQENKRIHVVTGDLGYGMFDTIASQFPTRFHNVGAAEQLLLGTAVGLALHGKIPVAYTITPFFWRSAEWIRNYLNHERIPVKLLGGGRERDYTVHDGFTHDACDDVRLFASFHRVVTYWPTLETLEDCTQQWLYNYEPSYLNLCR